MIKEKFNLCEKTALVIGGRGFLGQHFCSALSECGANVYSADLPGYSIAAEKNGNRLIDDRVIQKEVDVTKEASVGLLINEIIKEASRIDIFMYSVTTKPDDFYKPYTKCSLQGWQKIMSVELDGMFLATQKVGKHMEEMKSGSIILTSSIYGVVGNDQRIYEGSNLNELYADSTQEDSSKKIYAHAGYAAAKGAVISTTRYLAAYWGAFGIRVNCISPGGVEHPGENATFIKKYAERTPLQRKAQVDDLTGGVIYLASDASRYVTGHNLVMDGGWTIW